MRRVRVRASESSEGPSCSAGSMVNPYLVAIGCNEEVVGFRAEVTDEDLGTAQVDNFMVDGGGV